MGSNEAYYKTEDEFNETKNEKSMDVWTVTGEMKGEKTYSYEEAINLAGNGGYTIGLLATLSMTVLAMGCDMFGFSVVVAGLTCDLEVTPGQRGVLMSMPFLGAIIMSYPWGYISDTKGRHRSLMVAMLGTFLATSLSAFSPHWIMLAVLKFVSTSCCSCAQSVTYALLGESASERVRGPYMLTMTGVLMLTPSTYFVAGYFILNFEFSYDLGFIRFVPWRLLVLVLVTPVAISILLLRFFFESPKFLANAGHEDEAVELLKKIWLRNGGKGEYPVTKLILNEDKNKRTEKVPFLKSLREQTAPLFQRPLLWRTLQLYYLTAIMYSVNNGYLMWYPFIANAFFSGISTATPDQHGGLCNMVISSQNVTTVEPEICSPKLEFLTVISSIGHSISFAIINVLMSRGASRMKLMMIALLAISGGSGVAIVFTTNNVASLILFIGVMAIGLCIGIVFSYFNKLYPASYRGMTACLGVMVARVSSLIGTNILGTYIMQNCYTCFYAFTVYIFSGLVVAFFLPADRPKKTS
ncbi:hypothetical protein MSG28_008333 [Choristoneura fumiferana]|uniref:Uncharacterized protein n=1 Tax=Choristoneura fumiferana TaxID=7141 RepID=A0ACC0JAY5_CHOFU|nr:hypothetical protein MSG28_008333 [Choristoneura fumiferana]